MSAANNDEAVDRDEQAAGWCIELADGELGTEQQRLFDAWIGEPANAAALHDMTRAWRTAELAAEMPESIQVRTAALETFRRANRRRWTKKVQPRWYLVGGMAAVLLLTILSAVMLRDPTQSYQTGIAERRVAMLGDGSRVSLDAATEVEVKLDEGRRRVVLLHGRAKFDVAKDPLRPFSVTAGDKVVVATGTSFSVEVLGKSARVLLYEGHVAVLDRASNMPIRQRTMGRSEGPAADQLLTPGTELVLPIDRPSSPGSTRVIDAGRSLSWESGQLSFEDEDLADAAERMNRYSRKKVVVGDRAAALSRVSGTFDAGDVDAFVEGVAAINDLRATSAAGAITLRSR